MFGVGAVWMLSARNSTTTVLWLTLFVCWIGVLIAVVLGILFRRSFLWWCASTLTVLAIVLSVSLAMLDRLGSK
jgi:hypothetical protein